MTEQTTPQPAPSVDLTSTPRDAVHAQAMLNDLREHRTANRVTDRDFFSRSDYLGRIADGEQNATQTSAYETPAAQMQSAVSEAMAPPSSGAAYRFDYASAGASPDTDEARAFDTSLRNTLHELGVPERYGGYWYDSVQRLASRFEGADESTIRAHVASVRSDLERRWGADFKGKVDAIDELVTGIKGPVGDLLAESPWLLADSLVMQQLDDLVQHRKAKR